MMMTNEFPVEELQIETGLVRTASEWIAFPQRELQDPETSLPGLYSLRLQTGKKFSYFMYYKKAERERKRKRDKEREQSSYIYTN